MLLLAVLVAIADAMASAADLYRSLQSLYKKKAWYEAQVWALNVRINAMEKRYVAAASELGHEEIGPSTRAGSG